jgi:hypothetical protein
MKTTKSELKEMIREVLREELSLNEATGADRYIYLYVSSNNLLQVGSTLQRKVAELENVERFQVNILTHAPAFFALVRNFGKKANCKFYAEKNSDLPNLVKSYSNVTWLEA